MLTAIFLFSGAQAEEPAELVASWQAPLAVRRCNAPERDFPAGLEEASQSVWVLSTPEGHGSGVVISPDGFVLTAAHVVGDLASIDATSEAGLTLEATVLRVDPFRDVAILKVPGDGHPCSPLASAPIGLGEELYAVGAPLSVELSATVSRGIVSGYRNFPPYRLIQTDASISPGNSGGPLLTTRGEVAGIVSFKVVGGGMEGLAFGVPTDAVIESLELDLRYASDPDPTLDMGRVAQFESPLYEFESEEPSPARVRPERTAVDQSNRLIKLGAGGFVLSAAVVGGTWALYRTDPAVDWSQWRALQVANSVGWLGVAAGGVALGVGWFMPTNSPSVRPFLAPGRIGLAGRF